MSINAKLTVKAQDAVGLAHKNELSCAFLSVGPSSMSKDRYNRQLL